MKSGIGQIQSGNFNMLNYQTLENNTLQLLKELMQIPELDNFVLVGGTNLALRFGHRISVDIDLFTNEPFEIEEVKAAIASKFDNKILLGEKKQSLWFVINGIKVDFILHQYRYIKKIEIIDGIRMLSVQDIIPMKLQALAGRGVKKDFWDIYELLHHYNINEMRVFHENKYPDTDFGYIVLSLTYFADAEVQNEDPIGLKGVTWEEIKSKISRSTQEYITKSISDKL